MVSQGCRAICNSRHILGLNRRGHRLFSSVTATVRNQAVNGILAKDEVELGSASTSHTAETLLKTSADLLARCVESPESTRWLDRVDSTLCDMQRPRLPTIAFLGDHGSGARDLVTAMLEDPLSDDHQRRNALVRRFDNDPIIQTPLRIRFGPDNEKSGNELILSSPFLQRSDAEIVEVVAPSLWDASSHLLLSDTIILVTDNVRYLDQPGLRTLLLQFMHHPRVFLFLNRISPLASAQQDEAHIELALSRLFEDAPQQLGRQPHRIKIHSGSSTLAMDAIEIFRNGITNESSTGLKAAAMETYQSKYLSSRITTLASQISSSIPPILRTPHLEDNLPFQSQTATFLASRILSTCQASVASAETQIMEAEARVEHLKHISSSISSQLRDSLKRPQPSASAPPQESNPTQLVQYSIYDSSRHVKHALGQFSWWNLPWKVDDLQDRAVDAVMDHYGRELERNLLVFSGKLISERDELRQKTRDCVTFPQRSPFNSPVLINALEQMDKEVAGHSEDDITRVVTQPIDHRRMQLINPVASPVSYLYLRAQNLVSTVYIMGFGSIGSAWATWIMDYASSEMALGLGGLGMVGAVRWSVSRWRRIQKKFWDDWRRVEEGLEREVKSAVDNAIDQQVLKSPVWAAGQLTDSVAKRVKEVRNVEQELLEYAKGIEAVNSQLQY